MKRIFLTLALIAGMTAAVLADEFALSMDDGANVAQVAGRTTVYSFFVNVVAEPFRFPLVGFFNMMLGNHNLPQLGFVNHNTGDFSSFQAGFVNTTGGRFSGAQIGFVNTCGGNSAGIQTGFVNTSRGDVLGAQVSFINTAGSDLYGSQIGFINTSLGTVSGAQVGFINTSIGDIRFAQIGFINTSLGDMTGVQLGFINTSRGEMRGAQLGFINTSLRGGQLPQIGLINTSAGPLNGMQLGLINFADSIEDGIPIGLISIVRNGGFRAVEYVFSEFFPVGMGLKLGVERFYTNIFVAYDVTGDRVWENFSLGFGIGSIIPIGESFFFNPELTYTAAPVVHWDGTQQLLSFVPLAGFNINRHFSVIAGPSVTWGWARGTTDASREPFFSIVNHDINDRHSIVVGARAGLRFRF